MIPCQCKQLKLADESVLVTNFPCSGMSIIPFDVFAPTRVRVSRETLAAPYAKVSGVKVPMVMPRIVAPPGSCGSSAQPPSCWSTSDRHRSKLVWHITPRNRKCPPATACRRCPASEGCHPWSIPLEIRRQRSGRYPARSRSRSPCHARRLRGK